MASEQLNPIDNPQAWDVITIGGVQSPGICTISGFDRTYGWDVKKGKGTKGATLTFTDEPPSEGSVTFQLWSGDIFAEWNQFRPLLKYDPTKKGTTALDIYHPALADLDINSVVTKKISPIKHVGKQLYEVTVDFIEYFPVPPKSSVSTPSTSKTTAPNTTPGQTPDPVADAQQAEIAKLLAQARE